MMECKHTEIKQPNWLSNQSILLMQQHNARWRLISYNPENNTSSEVFRLPEGNIISYRLFT